MPKTDLIPEEIKAKYGDIKLYNVGINLEIDDETDERMEYTFKKPSTPSYDRYIKKCGDSPKAASNRFALDNVIEEHRDRLQTDLEEYPALALSITEKLFAMLGLAKSVDVKKL